MSDTNFTTLTLSTSPLLIYLSSFISQDEAARLLSLCEHSYITSPLISTPSSDTPRPPEDYRTSASCTLPNDDPTILALTLRVYNFLQALNIEADGIEPFQAVRYLPSQHYDLHYDWFETPVRNSDDREYNRLASFFLYLEADCSSSGGTNFPRISVPGGVLDKEERGKGRYGRTEKGDGIVFRPIVGNGMFWVNLRADGKGDEKVLHAGLVVEEGSKTGLNIWMIKLKDVS
ncbi:hypothetical protein ONS95_011320 [Cadophora gregata]|uniref:uncharacterized protein n=1 Tax=Cadophora gregata TaxID=51156 RepID=UPI0026DBE238|nr:uncharacterized protein ONS95_011320 [Cadophora gregata]KAK0119891.1 hypothetical protein ONS95_011320 [Cadophora gregata]KAK0120927.1 hypothetical protein ONS96_011124 [Cadophora gregata f. sp. sojae]